jgi:Caenorhabditis protein of unknown function, DUF268
MSRWRNSLKQVGYSLARASEWGLPKDRLDLSGDRDVEWAWIGAKMPANAGRVLDLGPATSFTPLVASHNAAEVVGFDLTPEPTKFSAPNLRYVQGDILATPIPAPPYDTIINCSTTEHIGLSGRYDNREEPDGDLRAMTLLRQAMASPASVMLFTIPVGLDGIYRPYHRVYGKDRLPKVLGDFKLVEDAFFAKINGENIWQKVARDVALDVQGSHSLYALGLFVLQRG